MVVPPRSIASVRFRSPLPWLFAPLREPPRHAFNCGQPVDISQSVQLPHEDRVLVLAACGLLPHRGVSLQRLHPRHCCSIATDALNDPGRALCMARVTSPGSVASQGAGTGATTPTEASDGSIRR